MTPGKSLPAAAAFLLGFGLKFIPIPKKSLKPTDIEEGVDRFDRDMFLKIHFAEDDEDDEPYEKLRVKSIWKPDNPPFEILQRLGNFECAIQRQFVPKRGKSNLTKFQAGILEKIRNNKSVIIAHADKNLGPVGVDAEQYIRWGLEEHLLDPTTYQLISEEDARIAANELYKTIYQWTRKHSLSDHLTQDSRNYIRQKIREASSDPFGYFYLTIKIHKTPISTRPVCSDLASLPHSLGQWVDLALQPVVTSQPTYFKDSFALKRELNTLVIPPNASLFTYDAVSMYTNIEIDDCLERISTFLSTIWDRIECAAVISAMEIVMRNNRMRFGDLIFHQIRGVAMGMSPAPTIANLYVAIYEATHILPLLTSFLFFLKRFIDDGLGIWLHDPDPDVDAANWILFKTLINAMGLKWTSTKLSKKVIFMDMTIKISGSRLVTALYAKPMALYQYIPPTSCHPPGALTGLVFGQVLRIFQLCSRNQDIDSELSAFYHRLLARGYKSVDIVPLLIKGIDNANHYLSLT